MNHLFEQQMYIQNNNIMPFWSQYCDAHQKVNWPSKAGRSQPAGRNTPRGRRTTKTAFLSKRRAVEKAEEFPQNFIDVCIRQSSSGMPAFPSLLIRTVLQVMQDGTIVKTGYFTALFICLFLNQREFKEVILQKIILAASAGKFWHIPTSNIGMLILTREYEMQTINRRLALLILKWVESVIFKTIFRCALTLLSTK